MSRYCAGNDYYGRPVVMTGTIKKIGIVGYWATSISTARSTVLSKKSDKYGFIPAFGH